MMHGTFGMRMLLKLRGRRVNLILLAQERIRGLLSREGFRDKVVAIRAKARSRLLVSQGIWHVSTAISLDT